MNCSSSLSSLVCILSASFACAADAQSMRSDPGDAPAVASSALIAPTPLQRSAQTATAGIATSASDAAASNPALAGTGAAAEPASRARSTLRRPLVPGRPSHPKAASAPADDAWRSDTLYASPYTTSPYAQPGDPD
ncbi:hypothetical protein [Burkholderia pyrrocinia]|uniref:hypothetical protein n=1 Tax=Burkholderia pyrrocinia TaxID=60550 RepID=UPI00158992F5|nr:hypothetical protein [Burkholderia pyrrocinia]